MSALRHHNWTVADYLAYERGSDRRHEYLDGTVYAMAGASARHHLIMANTLASLHAQLRQRPCIVYPSDLRVKVNRTALYTYPDISVVCGTPEFEDDYRDILLNPMLIIEVLSPSTESYDRGKKFQHYRNIDSLQAYVLIAQDSSQIERYTRQDAKEWLLADATQLSETFSLTAIGCTLALADVYEKVNFEGE